MNTIIPNPPTTLKERSKGLHSTSARRYIGIKVEAHLKVHPPRENAYAHSEPKNRKKATFNSVGTTIFRYNKAAGPLLGEAWTIAKRNLEDSSLSDLLARIEARGEYEDDIPDDACCGPIDCPPGL